MLAATHSFLFIYYCSKSIRKRAGKRKHNIYSNRKSNNTLSHTHTHTTHDSNVYLENAFISRIHQLNNGYCCYHGALTKAFLDFHQNQINNSDNKFNEYDCNGTAQYEQIQWKNTQINKCPFDVYRKNKQRVSRIHMRMNNEQKNTRNNLTIFFGTIIYH